jgi:hypothetical protein
MISIDISTKKIFKWPINSTQLVTGDANLSGDITSDP